MTVPGCVAVSLRPEFAGPLYQHGPCPVLHNPGLGGGPLKGTHGHGPAARGRHARGRKPGALSR
jgi:hypothetical protein